MESQSGSPNLDVLMVRSTKISIALRLNKQFRSDQNGFTPCTDQNEINSFIMDIVDLFESDDRVYAYAYTDGNGLGTVWPPTKDGQLTESGQTYLDAISKYS